MDLDWIYKTGDPLLETLLGSILIFIAVIIFTRIVGLRSFAKFTAYDFAFTVAIGSIISSTLTSKTSVVYGSVAIGSLLLLTYIFSTLQKKIPRFSNLISNKPLLLMDGATILEKNLSKSRIEKSQLMAKLREANVTQLNQVKAVVLEATGDISVLHKASEDTSAVEDCILADVKS
ncbi:DUF421 domain-containing protein [Winogradskyella litorisediminis]|uniref:DUF421 domain-containing protein n=1 Tax=Winogradskyella litorisediminis TaxID=1156618 RepID=A0ABW3ND70_9FLAO